MRRAMLVCAVVATMLSAGVMPAQAHDERGIHCRFASPGPVGRTFRVKVVNRTNFGLVIVCTFKTWGGGDGRHYWDYNMDYLQPHSSRYFRVNTPNGDWNWIDVAHSHGYADA